MTATSWPQKLRDEMYLYRGKARCWHCRLLVYVYQTPRHKMMLFDADFEPHFARCKNAPAKPHLARVIEFPRQGSLRF
jgi:hypothetical protein